jgi:hypothetical protein
MAKTKTAPAGTQNKYSVEHRARLRAILESWSPEETTNSLHLPQDLFDEALQVAQQALKDRHDTRFDDLTNRVPRPLREIVRTLLEGRAKRCITDLLVAGERVPADWPSFADLAAALDLYQPDLERGLDLAVWSSWVFMTPEGAELLTPPSTIPNATDTAMEPNL